MRTYRKLQPRDSLKDWGISTKEARAKCKSELSKLLNKSIIDPDASTTSDALALSDAAYSDLSKSSIDANSLANISFSLSLKMLNCLRKWSSWDKRVWRFSWIQEVISINTSSSAHNSAFSAWAFSSSSYKDSFCLSTWFPRKLLATENKKNLQRTLTITLSYHKAVLEILFKTAATAIRRNIHHTRYPVTTATSAIKRHYFTSCKHFRS